jgi:hypothetical protein
MELENTRTFVLEAYMRKRFKKKQSSEEELKKSREQGRHKKRSRRDYRIGKNVSICEMAGRRVQNGLILLLLKDKWCQMEANNKTDRL